VWYATEVFGKAAKLVRGAPPVEEYAVGPPPASTAEAIARLVVDYEGTDDDPRPYFLTGKMDVALYDVDCEFADPFVSFRGRQRFKENLENLAGGFITDSSVRTLDTSSTDTSYTTRLLVKLQLGLPWKPVLAWPWGVEHVFDEQSGLIVQHIERWEVSPAEGVRQLLRAGPPNGLQQGRRGGGGGGAVEESSAVAAPAAAASRLGTMDPIAGPLVKAARAAGLMEKEEADGWSGEPTAWAEKDSLPQKLSEISATRLAGVKQWVAERVAGDFDQVAIDARLDADIGSAAVVLFSFTSCPFCKLAKEALEAKGVTYTAIELDLDPDGAAVRARLGARTTRTSVPSIWIGGEFVCGLNDGPGLLTLDTNGDLEPKLRAVGALA